MGGNERDFAEGTSTMTTTPKTRRKSVETTGFLEELNKKRAARKDSKSREKPLPGEKKGPKGKLTARRVEDKLLQSRSGRAK